MLENCIVIDGLKKIKSGNNNSRENFDFVIFYNLFKKCFLPYSNFATNSALKYRWRAKKIWFESHNPSLLIVVLQ